MQTDTLPVIGHVQADAFCEGCGYNLHTQAVTRDERLGILICRCPECGRITAAANLTTARSVWLNRLGLGLLILWIMFLIVLFGLTTLFHGISAYGLSMEAVEFQALPPTQPGVWAGYHYVKRQRQLSEFEAYQRRVQIIMVATLCVALGCIAGSTVSVGMWHVRGPRRLLAFAPALVGVGFTFWIWTSDITLREVHDVARTRMAIALALQCLGALIGLQFGRPIARAALSILVPPVPRQHLAFLWTTDGKTLKL